MSEEEGPYLSHRPTKRQRRSSLSSLPPPPPASPPGIYFPGYIPPPLEYTSIDNSDTTAPLDPPAPADFCPGFDWGNPQRDIYLDLPSPWNPNGDFSQAPAGPNPSYALPPPPMDMRNMDGGLEDLLEPPAPRERRRRRGWSGGGRSGQLASASSRSLPAPSGPREYINIEDSPPPLSPSRLSPLFGVEGNTDVKPGPSTSSQNPLPTTTTLPPPPSAQSGPAPARDYTCPICFSAPTAAVLTPCGHVTCGACLFSSVEVAQKRSRSMGYGGDALLARCPVCRAVIQDWDGKGAGVIGLEFKVGPVMRS